MASRAWRPARGDRRDGLRYRASVAGPTADELAGQLDARLTTLGSASTKEIRKIRREVSMGLRDRDGAVVLATARTLVARHRWVAYELIHHHPAALAMLDRDLVEQLGEGLGGWGDVDAFGRYISGPAWQRELIADEVVLSWSTSSDRWWRRAALVSTVPLNLRAAGGTGDGYRTIAVCTRVVEDRDDMVVKALSWALRELIVWDPDAVRNFLQRHDGDLAPRVRREVTNKLETGLKNRR